MCVQIEIHILHRKQGDRHIVTLLHLFFEYQAKEFLDKLRNDKKIRDKVQVIVERKDVIYKMKLDVEDL